MKYINNLKGNLKILVSLQTGANILKVNKIEVNKIKINSVCLNNNVYRCFSCSSYVKFVGGGPAVSKGRHVDPTLRLFLKGSPPP